MVWSWSHASEAYADAQSQVEAQEREWLEVVYAEWHAVDDIEQVLPDFDEHEYEAALSLAGELSEDVLAEFIWEKMSEQATCQNGGHDAWACPYGCHTVPFSPVDNE